MNLGMAFKPSFHTAHQRFDPRFNQRHRIGRQRSDRTLQPGGFCDNILLRASANLTHSNDCCIEWIHITGYNRL
ncbi:hypothetical protein D3C77_667910 [compost metagenome]